MADIVSLHHQRACQGRLLDDYSGVIFLISKKKKQSTSECVSSSANLSDRRKRNSQT